MSSLGLKETYVGCAAQKLRGILDICHPIRQGSAQKLRGILDICHPIRQG